MTVRSCWLRQNPAYRPGGSRLLRRLAGATLGVLLVGGCAPRVPEQVIKAPAPVVAPLPDLPVAWAPRPTLVAREYQVEQRALVTTTTDSGARDDSVSLHVSASVRNTLDRGVAGLVRGVTVGAPGAAAQPLPGVTFPYAFAASASVRGLEAPLVLSAAGDGNACVSPAQSVLGALRDLVFRVPDSLSVGVQWADSSSVATCRDGVPLDIRSLRTFRVVRYERRGDRDVVLVDRTMQTSVRGESVRGDDTTRVEGSGRGSLRYEIDPLTGDVESATGSATLDLGVRGRVRSERALQSSAVRIVRRVQ